MKNIAAILLVLAVLAATIPVSSPAGILAVPEKFQEKDQWCWAGVSQAILCYYGKYFSQTQIAQYGTQGYNTWNWIWGYDNESPYFRRGIDYILNNFGAISSTGRAYALSQSTVTSEIVAGRPFVIRWGWDSEGGHFLAGRGIVGSNVYYMDPWPGNGYKVGTYSWVVRSVANGHTWTHSLKLTTSPPTPPSPASTRAALQLYAADFTGDGYSNIAIFRPSTGLWSIRGWGRAYFGRSGDIPVPADYNGNGTANIAIFRPSSGLWSVRGLTRFYFGRSGDVPLPMNYRAGYVTAGIFRASSGLWSFRGGNRFYFGRSGDIPVIGPWTTRSGSWGAPRIAIFRPSTGLWSILGVSRFYFGRSGDIPVPGDYQTSYEVSTRPWRAALFRPSTGLWSVRGITRAYFGRSGDYPVPADYAGGWGDEIAIFRPSTGLWSIRGYQPIYYGSTGDLPAVR